MPAIPGKKKIVTGVKGAAKQFLAGLDEMIEEAKPGQPVGKIGDLPPVEGQPQTANIPNVGKTELGGNAGLKRVAEEYAADKGIDYKPPQKYVEADPDLGERTASAFESGRHAPTNPEVKRAYQALADETVSMYESLLDAGYNPYWIGKQDPYQQSPYLSLMDLSQNKALGIYPTREGFGTDAGFDPGGNPLLEPSGHYIDGEPALVNDLFRFVHDAFGHGIKGVGFRAGGERNAFLEHFAMFGEDARRAAASETHGQNSWLNFGPNGITNRNAKVEDTVFADQKSILLPNSLAMEGTEIQNARLDTLRKIIQDDDRGLQGALTPDGQFQLIHYSKQPLETVDPKYQFKGLRGKTREEVNRLSDRRAPKRQSFGFENVARPYQREQGLGDVKNRITFPAAQMYDAVNDPDGLKDRPGVKGAPSFQEYTTLLEREIHRAGYSGYFVDHPQLRMVAQIFEPVETETGKAARKGGKTLKSITIPLLGVGGIQQKLQHWSEERQKDNSIIPTILMDAGLENDFQVPGS
jgi:hypothetical protein